VEDVRIVLVALQHRPRAVLEPREFGEIPTIE
jgi:hypothetical protein